MPLWLLTLGFGAFSAIMAFRGARGSISHMARLSGLVVGWRGLFDVVVFWKIDRLFRSLVYILETEK